MFDPKKLGEEADNMISKLNQQAKEAGVDDTEQAEPVAENQAEAQEVAITEGEDAVVEEDQGAEVVAETAEDNTPNNDLIAELRKQVEQSDQRWKVLQGMINKKDEEIEAMRSLLAQLNEMPAKQETAQVEETPQTLITKDDIDEYGKDMIDVMRRAGQEAAASAVSRLMKQFDERLRGLEANLSNVSDTTARVTRNSFESTLTGLVPDWRELNVNQDFIGWLQDVDPYTGYRKIDLLSQAAQAEDAHRASVFFNEFKKLTAPVEQPQAQQAPKQNGKEKLIAPGKVKGTTPKQEDKRIWTRQEIARVYDDKMAGRISQKEFEKLERDFFAAQSEGRIAA